MRLALFVAVRVAGSISTLLMHQSPSNTAAVDDADRRGFFGDATARTLMAAGLVGGYGTIAWMGLRFLMPTDADDTAWVLVARADQIAQDGTLEFKSPAGERIVIARRQAGDTAESFIALSSVCPHLGCRVFWEPQNSRFFCPCHNGAFNAEGEATEGPPAKEGQSLSRYPLKVEEGLLFIRVSLRPLLARRESASSPSIQEA
jgi:cytochrome b6-f complex iron-sulfur subunit